MSEVLPVYNRYAPGEKKPRILVADKVSPSFYDAMSDYEMHDKAGKFKSAAELARYAGDERINYIIIRSATNLREAADVDALGDIPSLVGFGRSGVGADNINQRAALLRGLVLQNTQTGTTETVGEHALTLGLGLFKRIGPNLIATLNGTWDKHETKEMAEKNVLVVAAGKIGVDFGSKAHALRAHVTGYDPYSKKPAFLYGGQAMGVSGRYVDGKTMEKLGEPHMKIFNDERMLIDLLANANMVSVHAPGEDLEKPVIGRREFESMKEGSIFVHTSRPEAVDYNAALWALRERDISLGFDVLPKEGADFINNEHVARLREAIGQGHNVLITHHTAGNSEEGQERLGQELASNIDGLFQRGEIQNGLTVPNTDPRQDSDVGSQPRLVIVNSDEKGVIEMVSGALRDANLSLHQVPFAGRTKFMGSEVIDVLGYDLKVNGSTPESVAGAARDALEKLFRDNEHAKRVLKRAMIF